MSRRTKRQRTRGGGGFTRRQRTVNWAALGLLVVGLPAVWFWAWRGAGSATRLVVAPNSNLPLCPVGGEPVNLAVSVPTDEGPIFFCCKHCIDKYRADPSKYAAGVEAERRVLATPPRVQVRCPVSGKPASPEIFVERGAEKTYFCSEDCREKFQSEPERFRAGVAASYTYQTKCPVSGRPIWSNVSTTAEGVEVYLCSKDCLETFRRNPTKFADRLAEQGVRIWP